MTLPRTRRLVLPLAALAVMLPLSGCDWIAKTTGGDTAMRNVEIEPGTTSDEMITLDQTGADGNAIDPSTVIGPPVATIAKPRAAAASESAADTASSDAAPASSEPARTPPAAASTPAAPAPSTGR